MVADRSLLKGSQELSLKPMTESGSDRDVHGRVTLCTMPEMEYFCTQSAHNAESLTLHMNAMARRGWELLAVDFALRGETGFHTFFWRRPLRRSAAAERQATLQE